MDTNNFFFLFPDLVSSYHQCISIIDLAIHWGKISGKEARRWHHPQTVLYSFFLNLPGFHPDSFSRTANDYLFRHVEFSDDYVGKQEGLPLTDWISFANIITQ